MRILAALPAVLLLASLGLPGAAADDVRVGTWMRLLERSEDGVRPLLGLLAVGDGAGARGDPLEADPGERPGLDEAGGGEADDGEAVAWLLARGHGSDVTAGLLRRVAVDVEVRLPSGDVHRGRLISVPGRRASLSRTRCLRAITDYSAELACDNSGGLRPSAVGDPVPSSFLEGLAVDVRPFPVGHDRVALDVLVQAGRFDRPVARLDTQALFLGNLDLPRYRGVLLAASGSTSVRESLELAVSGDHGERYVVRLTPRILDVPASEDRPRVRRLDARFLVAPWVVVGFSRRPDAYVNPPAHVLPEAAWMRSIVDRSDLREHVDRLLPETETCLRPDGDVWIVAEESAVARVGRTFDAWAARAARTVRVELTARAGDEVVGRVDVPVLTGRAAFFRLGVDRALLLGSDVEVG